MFKISTFSKLGQVSIKALRLYDHKGLLPPAWVDPETGYRYYTVEQLPRLNRILALKGIGLTLEQIHQLLSESLSVEEIRGMLKLKQAELLAQLELEQKRLAQIDVLLTYLDEETSMSSHDVVIKSIEEITVISIRETLPSYSGIGQTIAELYHHTFEHGAQPGSYLAALWHDPDYKEQDVDGEAVLSVAGSVPETERIRYQTLPAVAEMACVVYHGSYTTIPSAYNDMMKWIEANQYTITGPSREIYLKGGPEQDNADYVTEIQFPVVKQVSQ